MLKQTVAEAERAIDAIIAADPDLAAKGRIITSVRGVGPKTMRVILAELPELGLLTAQSIAALCGLAPYHRKSGKSDRGAKSKAAALRSNAQPSSPPGPWCSTIHGPESSPSACATTEALQGCASSPSRGA